MGTRARRRKIEQAYKRACREELCCKDSGREGRRRRGRKKGKVILFPFPKRGKHLHDDHD